MTDDSTGYKHSASDRKLDQAAEAETKAREGKDSAHASGPGHDPEHIREHDDTGKDRLFEAREQRDDAERLSERNRLEQDVARHGHDDEKGGANDANAIPDRV